MKKPDALTSIVAKNAQALMTVTHNPNTRLANAQPRPRKA